MSKLEDEARELVLVRASDIPPAPPEVVLAVDGARRAAYAVLPPAWRVLPDGRATAAVIASALAEVLLTEVPLGGDVERVSTRDDKGGFPNGD
jgi:hypothetical protein